LDKILYWHNIHTSITVATFATTTGHIVHVVASSLVATFLAVLQFVDKFMRRANPISLVLQKHTSKSETLSNSRERDMTISNNIANFQNEMNIIAGVMTMISII
jgi:hypothetical protein